jgi:hypothetical protein
MYAGAFLIGFFTALGWISAHKVVSVVEKPPTVIQKGIEDGRRKEGSDTQ